jgi:hypothetical protein
MLRLKFCPASIIRPSLTPTTAYATISLTRYQAQRRKNDGDRTRLLSFASRSIHDLSRSACVARAAVCEIAPGAPIGGCDPAQPLSKAATLRLEA